MPFHNKCFGRFNVRKGNWAATPVFTCEKCGCTVEPGCEGFEEEVKWFDHEYLKGATDAKESAVSKHSR